jgi:hypothetical protein
MGKKQKQQHRLGGGSDHVQDRRIQPPLGRGKGGTTQQAQQPLLQQPQQQPQENEQQQQQQNQQQQNQQQQHTPSKQYLPESFLRSIEKWFRAEQQGIVWVLGCVMLGCLFGFGIGSGWLTGASTSSGVALWRVELGERIRSSLWYQLLFLLAWNGSSSSPSHHGSSNHALGSLHPNHPRIYAVLREAIVREINGYVHPDLGIMTPAPCGAPRGLGMVRDSYQKCQSKCFPGVAKEKMDLRRNQQQKLLRDPENQTLWLPPIPDHAVYKQEEVLVRVPLAFQMTRAVALETIMPRLPGDVLRKANLHELDDAALLVLLLAHERGVGRHSRWLPYIASLPQEPTCGYSPNSRQSILMAMKVLQEELGVDTYGWKGELSRAHKHAARIAHGLAKDYGAHIQTPEGMTPVQNMEWALCQVTSRATGGSELYGALRMVPLMDIINHDAAAGGFVELSGKERLGTYLYHLCKDLLQVAHPHHVDWQPPIAHGDFIEATEDDAGTFVVRSLRHGRRKALKKGQELLVNYNVPHYSPLDWFVSLGFVPPERQSQWVKIDAALPRVRQDAYGVSSTDSVPTTQQWEETYGLQLLTEYKEQQKRKKQGYTTPSTAPATGSAGGDSNTPATTTSANAESISI